MTAAQQQGAGNRVWQSSHLGGHRFAPMATTFPDGLSYGRLGPGEGGLPWQAAARQEAVALHRWRGLSLYPPVVQAAEILLLRQGADPGPLLHCQSLSPVNGIADRALKGAEGPRGSKPQPAWRVRFARGSIDITSKQAQGQVRAKSCGASQEAIVAFVAAQRDDDGT